MIIDHTYEMFSCLKVKSKGFPVTNLVPYFIPKFIVFKLYVYIDYFERVS